LFEKVIAVVTKLKRLPLPKFKKKLTIRRYDSLFCNCIKIFILTEKSGIISGTLAMKLNKRTSKAAHISHFYQRDGVTSFYPSQPDNIHLVVFQLALYSILPR
jgi:hypothetical protein